MFTKMLGRDPDGESMQIIIKQSPEKTGIIFAYKSIDAF